MGGQREPEQRNSRGPARFRHRLKGAKFDQAPGAAGKSRVPELVEAGLGSVGVARSVALQMDQRVGQPLAMILSRGQFLQPRVGHLEVGQTFARFVRPRRLRGRTDVGAGERIGQRGVVLPKTQDGGDPSGTREERIFLHRWAAKKQMVAAPGARCPSVFAQFPRDQAGGFLHALEDLQPCVILGPIRARR